MSSNRLALVIGASGFTGGHVVTGLEQAGYEVTGASKTGGGGRLSCDLTDPAAIARLLTDHRFDAVVMAAGISSVRAAWHDPALCFRVNVGGVFNLLEAIRASRVRPHLVITSSAAVYGPPASPADLPFTETSATAPGSPYAASKMAGEIFCRQYSEEHALPITVMRLFNLVGPGQGVEHAPAEFARQIAVSESEGHDTSLLIGNPDAKRDFTDVRDAAAAIISVLEGGFTGTFNVCSGRSASIAAVAELLADSARIGVRTEVEPNRAHPADIDEINGSADKLAELTGWRATTELQKGLEDLLEYWRGQS